MENVYNSNAYLCIFRTLYNQIKDTIAFLSSNYIWLIYFLLTSMKLEIQSWNFNRSCAAMCVRYTFDSKFCHRTGIARSEIRGRGQRNKLCLAGLCPLKRLGQNVSKVDKETCVVWPICDFKIFVTFFDLALTFKCTKYRVSSLIVP